MSDSCEGLDVLGDSPSNESGVDQLRNTAPKPQLTTVEDNSRERGEATPLRSSDSHSDNRKESQPDEEIEYSEGPKPDCRHQSNDVEGRCCLETSDTRDDGNTATVMVTLPEETQKTGSETPSCGELPPVHQPCYEPQGSHEMIQQEQSKEICSFSNNTDDSRCSSSVDSGDVSKSQQDIDATDNNNTEANALPQHADGDHSCNERSQKDTREASGANAKVGDEEPYVTADTDKQDRQLSVAGQTDNSSSVEGVRTDECQTSGVLIQQQFKNEHRELCSTTASPKDGKEETTICGGTLGNRNMKNVTVGEPSTDAQQSHDENFCSGKTVADTATDEVGYQESNCLNDNRATSKKSWQGDVVDGCTQLFVGGKMKNSSHGADHETFSDQELGIDVVDSSSVRVKSYTVENIIASKDTARSEGIDVNKENADQTRYVNFPTPTKPVDVDESDSSPRQHIRETVVRFTDEGSRGKKIENIDNDREIDLVNKTDQMPEVPDVLADEASLLSEVRRCVVACRADIQRVRQRYEQQGSSDDRRASPADRAITGDRSQIVNSGSVLATIQKIKQIIRLHEVGLLEIRRREQREANSTEKYTFAVPVGQLIAKCEQNKATDDRCPDNVSREVYRWSGENIWLQTEIQVRNISGLLWLTIQHSSGWPSTRNDPENTSNGCEAPSRSLGQSATDLKLAHRWITTVASRHVLVRPTRCRVFLELLDPLGCVREKFVIPLICCRPKYGSIISKGQPLNTSGPSRIRVSELQKGLITNDGYLFISVQALPL